MDLIFNAIADVMPNLREISEPVRLRSGWFNGIKHLPVSYAASLSAPAAAQLYPERTRLTPRGTRISRRWRRGLGHMHSPLRQVALV